ncbi:MAG: nucleotidyltransferase domain-containing protein [Deltaproteobacteria bacterium]|nr:nucleotidyltransferase domain-containing protein [Deltaproteobacteria bacterium]MDQ3300039.1 nucleotidyltransferase domain-containing protein [Myxococcota bacterium]
MTSELDPWRVLTPHQAEVARRFLAERERERRHLVIYLSGAHAYGFPSPDSDLDLKCIHIAPTSQLVGLDMVDDPGDRIEIVDGVELDYGSNELAPVLRGVLKGNGNYLERILGELALGGDRALLDEARAVVKPLLSRRVGRHYGGFATSQLRMFDDKPTAKRALYVLRTAATGRHALAHGEIVTDVAHLGAYVPPEITELLAIKRTGEREQLAPDHAQVWRGRLAAAIDAIDTAWPRSILPPDPPPAAIAALDGWLRDVRRRFW